MPALASGRIPARSGRRIEAEPSKLRARQRNSSAAPTWAITVDQADPAIPVSNPNTSTTSSTALTKLAPTRIQSGVM